MTGTNTKVRSLFLTALMVLSVFAGTVALSGSAVANHGVGNHEQADSDDNLDTHSTFWQGQVLWATGLQSNETYQIRTNDDIPELVREFTTDHDGDRLISTSSLDAGQYVVRAPSGDYVPFNDGTAGTQSSDPDTTDWEIAVQDLSVTADPGTVGNSGETTNSTVTVDSNRGGSYSAVVTSDSLSDDDLVDIFPSITTDTLPDSDGVQVNTGQEDTHELDFSGIEGGNHTLEWAITDSTASDDVTIEVDDVGGADANFAQSVVQEERGDIASFTLDLQNSNSANVTIGDIDDVNYVANLSVEDGDDDGQVTVLLNTWAPQASSSFTTASSDDDVTLEDSGGTTSVLDAADYDMVSSISGDEKDVGTLILNDRGTTGVTTMTSPRSPFPNGETAAEKTALEAAGELTADESIASQDIVVFKVESSGIYGALEAQSGSTVEDQFINLLNDGDAEVDFSMVQTNPAPNQDPKELDVGETHNNDAALNIVPDEDNETLYVAMKSNTMVVERGGDETNLTPQPGERYNTTFTVLSDGDLASADENAYADSRYVARRANFNAQSQTAENEPLVIVPAEENATVNGVTTIAPGTDLSVRARATGDSPFLKTADAEVSEDGTFSADFDLSNVSEGQNFTLTIPNQGFDGDAETAARTGAAATATVSISDQSSDGSTVVVDSVNMSNGGFVTIHDATLLEGNALTSVRGSSGYLSSGEQTNVEVSLDSPLEESQTVIAMPHMDTNDNQQYDFVSSEGADDGPYTEGGEAVTDDASVTIETETPDTGTPTDTATPTEEPDTATATDTPTDTDGQPGFGLVVSVLALLGAALLALRRD